MIKCQTRNKLFYISPERIKDYPYPSRMAIGMNFKDFRGMNSDVFRYRVKGQVYQISKEKALPLGNKYVLEGGIMPNLIPIEEWEKIDDS